MQPRETESDTETEKENYIKPHWTRLTVVVVVGVGVSSCTHRVQSFDCEGVGLLVVATHNVLRIFLQPR